MAFGEIWLYDLHSVISGVWEAFGEEQRRDNVMLET